MIDTEQRDLWDKAEATVLNSLGKVGIATNLDVELQLILKDTQSQQCCDGCGRVQCRGF